MTFSVTARANPFDPNSAVLRDRKVREEEGPNFPNYRAPRVHWIIAPGKMQLKEQKRHADKASDRKDINRGRGLFPNINFSLSKVVKHGQSLRFRSAFGASLSQLHSYCGYTNPCWKKRTWILRGSRYI